MKLPNNITNTVLSKYEKFPIALTGCMTTDHALKCCEYDFVIVTSERGNELLQVNDDYAEILKISTKLNLYGVVITLHNMQIINDPSWTLASLKMQLDTIIVKALSWYARNRTVDALFYATRAREFAKSNVLRSSLWLKCAAYYYLEAVLAYNGMRPMPTHMLAQLRSLTDKTASEGIALASSSLGLERANRSSVSRCMEACIGMNDKIKQDYSTKIVVKKAQHLYHSGMYTDCYFYLGYISRNAVISIASNQRALRDYTHMISIAMDLTTDQSFVIKLSKELLDSCNMLLKK